LKIHHPATFGMKAIGLTIFLSLPYGLGCGGDGEPAEAQVTEADPVMSTLLESATESQEAPRQTSPRISPEDQASQPLQISAMGYTRGSEEAPVKVLEISDFGCGYCRRFHEETFPDLLEVYVESGLVEWKFIPFVLGMFPNGLQAATAGECAGEQGQFFAMQSRLFADQGGWRNSEDPYAFFSDLAGDQGLDVDRFVSCIQGGWRDNQVRANIRLGQQAGARGTPFFLVDGRQVAGALPLEDFRTVLDGALLQRGITPPSR
jgi:protein-disulfide isomerase